MGNTLPTRFFQKVSESPSGCWEWTASRDIGGYGTFWDGRQRRNRKAHRVAYEALVGPIAIDRELDHLCRNRACCNPAHLEPVTRAENIRRSPDHPSVIRRQRTECKHGHPYSGDNLAHGSDGYRLCRTCEKDKQVRRRQRKAVH